MMTHFANHLRLSFLLLAVIVIGAAHAEPPTRITLAAVGDVLMHMTLVNAAHDAKANTYNFSPMFAPMVPYLTTADYATANLETCLAGEAKGYSGYPRFNTPASLAAQLKKVGFSMLSTANNHCLDMGYDGLVTTLKNLDAAGLPHIGTYRSTAEKATPFIADIRGVKVAFLNYTSMTNGIPVPKGKSYAVNYIDSGAITKEAQAARKQEADLVVAVLHFGTEYQRQPSDEQRKLATTLFANGVDVIIGAHPHVVQPIEKITVKRNGVPFTGVVVYSLGNFISNQRDRYRDSGIAVFLTIEKGQGKTVVQGVNYLPFWVQKRLAGGRAQYRVLPVHPLIKPNSNLPLTAGDRQRMSQVWEELNALLKNPEQGIIPYQVTPAGG
ncbi:MAG: CapA family protein [Armatimonadota bacterium]